MMENDDTCGTAFSRADVLNRFQLDLLVVLNLIIIALNMLTNGIVIILMRSTRQLKNTSFRLIYYLSVSDVCLAVFCQGTFVLLLGQFIRRNDTLSCLYKHVTILFFVWLTHTSGFCVVLIALDRHLRIKYLNGYATIVTRRRECYAVASNVLLSLILGISYVIGALTGYLSAVRIFVILVDFTAGLTTIYLYVKTMLMLKQHRHLAQMERTVAKLKTAMKISSQILASLCAFYTMGMFVKLLYSILYSRIDSEGRQRIVFLLYLSYTFVFVNSVANAIIFISLNKKLRSALISTFCRHRDRAQSHSTSHEEIPLH